MHLGQASQVLVKLWSNCGLKLSLLSFNTMFALFTKGRGLFRGQQLELKYLLLSSNILKFLTFNTGWW